MKPLPPANEKFISAKTRDMSAMHLNATVIPGMSTYFQHQFYTGERHKLQFDTDGIFANGSPLTMYHIHAIVYSYCILRIMIGYH